MKVRVNYCIEKTVKEEFDKICVENSINRSALIEKFLKEYIKENGKKEPTGN